MAGIQITAGEKLHCREKSSHVGNKTRQTGTKLASSDPNPPARMDWLSRIRRGVYGALPYMCVWRVFPVRKGRDWNHRGNQAPLSGEKLARREQNSPDGNKTRQQWSQSQCKNGLVVEDKARCVRCVTLHVCLTCVSCPKRQGLKSPRESSSTVGRKAQLSGEKHHYREKSSHDGNKTPQTGTKLASSYPNPNARMDWLSRIRRGVYGALPYLCVWRVFPIRNGRDSNHRGNQAPLSGEKLARREQNSPDGNKTRQQWSQSQCKNGLVVEDKAGCVPCVTLLVCLTCVPCSKWQGFKSPREKSSTVGRKGKEGVVPTPSCAVEGCEMACAGED